MSRCGARGRRSPDTARAWMLLSTGLPQRWGANARRELVGEGHQQRQHAEEHVQHADVKHRRAQAEQEEE
eukprot:14120560-Alexandrium_andersonii.AAC.1